MAVSSDDVAVDHAVLLFVAAGVGAVQGEVAQRGELGFDDPRHRHLLRRQQHHLRPTPGHHRPGAPPHDPLQPSPGYG